MAGGPITANCHGPRSTPRRHAERCRMATVDGLLHVPNAGMLAAAVAPPPPAAASQNRRTGPWEPAPADPDGVAPDATRAGAHVR